VGHDMALTFIKPTGTTGTLKSTGDAARDKVVSERLNLGYVRRPKA
jgi:hypothetical protein